MNTVKPYKDEDGSKKEQVAKMFDSIAPKYDFLNHFLSMGIDKSWRKKAIALLRNRPVVKLLDIATGTGDFAIEAAKNKNIQITGIDISEQMLEEGRKKIEKLKLSQQIKLEKGDSEKIQFADNEFDAVTVAFGVRNFENLHLGLKEMNRVLNPSGIAIILEFSKPTKFPFKQFYHFYFIAILPFIGRMVSSDRAAYTYLPESVHHFPDGKAFLLEMENAGFKDCKAQKLTFGVASIYTGVK